MNECSLNEAREELMKLQRRICAYSHAIDMIQYDGVTGAPGNTAANRGASLSVLSEELYRLTTSEETVRLLETLDGQKEALSQKEQRMVYLLYKELRDMRKIPMEEYVAFQELLVEADDVWHTAKNTSDFPLFRPYLEKIFATQKRFAEYIEPDKDPYEHWLSQFEEGLTVSTLDHFFDTLRAQIVPLLADVMKKPSIDDSMRRSHYPIAAQEKLSHYLMERMGLDLGHVGLAVTEHPFTTSLGSHFDVRITTHYYEEDFISSMYSVIHEGGHALYDSGSADDLAYTVLDGGTSMSIHESQSRFYENIIGRSRAFCDFLFPKLRELFPESLRTYSAEDFYRVVNKAEPSLIRTEADELTYCLHVMVRYELEKRVFAGELEVGDLPAEWNRLYRDYLGVEVPDDKHGILQDSHWAGGAIGYFPSYALGNAYGAQFLAKMKETVDVDGCIAQGNFAPVNDWNRKHIWQYGRLYTPAQILDRVLGQPFDPQYYLDYLRDKYTAL